MKDIINRKLNIALMAGGDSSERGVSLKSAGQVAASLDRGKYNVYVIDVLDGKWSYSEGDAEYTIDKNDFSLTIDGKKVCLDYALILIHGTPGEDGKLQAYLEMAGVPFSSSDMVSSVITFDKLACKRAVAPAGIAVAREVCIRKGDQFDAQALIKELGLPLFVKPNASGSSFGVTKVTEAGQLAAAVDEARRESDEVLVEEFLDGREIGCGVLVTKNKEYVFPVTEIISKKDFFDFEAKYTPGFSDEITPADLDEKTVRLLNSLTLRAYKACNCRGVVRIDFMVKKDGTPVMIEINSVPGMSEGSIVPQQAACAGMSLGQLFDIVIEDTFFERG